MKIQVIKSGTPRGADGAVCPWFVDVPGEKKS
jgi:hypothetical protein